MSSATLVKQVEMELGKARREMEVLEAARAILAPHMNGGGPEPGTKRTVGRPRKATARRTRAKATTRRRVSSPA